MAEIKRGFREEIFPLDGFYHTAIILDTGI